MAIHRFAINVPNPTSRNATVQLTLERVSTEELNALAIDIPREELRVLKAGISLDPCAEGGPEKLRVSVDSLASRDVQVVIETAPGEAAGSAAFHLVDQRGGKVAGGVLLACVENAAESGGSLIGTHNPCPVAMAGEPYVVLVGADPSGRPRGRASPEGVGLDLVVPVVNPTSAVLHDVTVYLEHLGLSDLWFEPATWNVGTLNPGQVFYPSWSISANGKVTGQIPVCVVVGSRDVDPVRLQTKLPTSERRRRPR
jgi:hypothetical protein